MRIFFDSNLKICDKSFKKTPQGYLLLDGIISRSGSQDYLDIELQVGNVGNIISVERPVEEVIDTISISSFINMPVTDEHPTEGNINPSNFSSYVKGSVLDAEATPKNQVKASMIIFDADLIRKIEDGKRELSAGYSAELEFSDDGKSAIQRKIRGNHVAFVDAARCGKECSIFDSKPKKEDTHMAKMKIKGTEYEVADAIAPAIQVVLDENKTLISSVSDEKAKHDKTQAMLDAADKKVKEMEDEEDDEEEKKKSISDAAHELLAVLNDAALIVSDLDATGKSSYEIKSAAVLDSLPDLKDKSEAYIEARFDIMVSDAKSGDKITDALSGGAVLEIVDSEKARAESIKRKQNQWKRGEK